MNKAAIIALAVGVLGIAAVGLTYTQCIQPNEKTFNQDTAWAWHPEQFPLSVGGPAAREMGVKTAVDAVNHAAGCKLLEYKPWAEASMIWIEDVGEVPCITGGCQPTEDYRFLEGTNLVHIGGRPNLVRIELYNAVGPAVRHCAVAHGFGHALDLDHDNFTASIMYDFACLLANEFPAPGFTDKDGDALSTRYCQ